jgi:hypothetical protein
MPPSKPAEHAEFGDKLAAFAIETGPPKTALFCAAFLKPSSRVFRVNLIRQFQ